MTDPTEPIRRILQAACNVAGDDDLPNPRWTTQELCEEFTVHGFLAPYVDVTRKADGQRGA